MEKIQAILLKIWDKFKALAVCEEFIFAYPFIVLAMLSFIYKNIFVVFLFAIWAAVLLINYANTPKT